MVVDCGVIFPNCQCAFSRTPFLGGNLDGSGNNIEERSGGLD